MQTYLMSNDNVKNNGGYIRPVRDITFTQDTFKITWLTWV